MPENYSASPLQPSVKWWKDPARRLQFIVISLAFAFFAIFSIGVGVPGIWFWQGPVNGIGLVLSYMGLVVQQWRVERGLAVIALGLVLIGVSAHYGLVVGYPMVCLQAYVISAYLHRRRRFGCISLSPAVF